MNVDRRLAVMATVTVLSFGAYSWQGGVAVGVALVLSLPLIGWAFDNDTGTFFILGLLTTIVCFVLLALISLLALAH